MLHIEASCQHLAVLPSTWPLVLPSTTFAVVRDGVLGLPVQHIKLYTVRNGPECAGDTRSYYQYRKPFVSHALPGVPHLACIIASKSTPNASD